MTREERMVCVHSLSSPNNRLLCLGERWERPLGRACWPDTPDHGGSMSWVDRGPPVLATVPTAACPTPQEPFPGSFEDPKRGLSLYVPLAYLNLLPLDKLSLILFPSDDLTVKLPAYGNNSCACLSSLHWSCMLPPTESLVPLSG